MDIYYSAYEKIGTRKRICSSIYLTVKNVITSGLVSPKEKIDEIEIANALDVSQKSVREALKILEFDHYVKYLKGKGYTVESITIEDVLKLYEFIGFISAFSMPLIDMNDITNQIILEESIKNIKEESNFFADKKFHIGLILCRNNSEILDMMEKTYDRLLWGFNILGIKDIKQNIIEDHIKIIDYIKENKNNSKEYFDILMRHYNLHIENIFNE
ncbi:MAG: GntR family transcriptional regulator [Eubacteriales bacterium]